MKRTPPAGFQAPDDLAEDHRAVIVAVVSADAAFLPESRLKGHDLTPLLEGGWLCRWTSDAADRAFQDVLWTLSTWAAAVLNLVLVEDLDLGEPRWGFPGDVPKFLRARRVPGERLLKAPELLRDPAPGPEQAMLDDEPLTLFDRKVPVLVDRRLKGKKRKSKAKGKTTRAKVP